MIPCLSPSQSGLKTCPPRGIRFGQTPPPGSKGPLGDQFGKTDLPVYHAPLAPLVELIERGEADTVDRIRQHLGISATADPIHIRDEQADAHLVVTQGDNGKPMVWFDFASLNPPLLEKLSEKFSFTAFVETNPEQDRIAYEAPYIDRDSIQLTAYTVQAPGERQKTISQPLHLYAGETFLITTHEGKNPISAKALDHFCRARRYKAPKDLMVLVLEDVFHHNGRAIEALTNDFKAASEKIAKPGESQKLFDSFSDLETWINGLHNVFLKQRRVINEFMTANGYEDSPYVVTEHYDNLVQELDHQLERLDHYLDRKNGLVNLNQSKISNNLDRSMKRLAVLGTSIAIPTMIAGFAGMNVAIPGSGLPLMFWWLVGGSVAASGGFLAWAKKKKWI